MLVMVHRHGRSNKVSHARDLEPTRRHRHFLAAVAALAGLAVTGLYVDAPNWVQQAHGTDLATLFLAVPVLVSACGRPHRGSSAGRLAVVAGLLYLVYNYAIFAFSVAMNPLTAVHIAIFGLALWSLLLAGRSAVDGAESVTERLNRRAAGGLLIGVGAMFGLLWLGQIATARTTGVLPPDLVKAGISSNPVYALDLAFFLPLCAIAGIGLLRRNGAAAFAFPMLIWVALMGAGVVGGFVLMAAAGDQIGGAGGRRHQRPRGRVLDPRRGRHRPTPIGHWARPGSPPVPHSSKAERHAARRTPDRGRRRLRRRPFRDGLHQLQRRRQRRFRALPVRHRRPDALGLREPRRDAGAARPGDDRARRDRRADVLPGLLRGARPLGPGEPVAAARPGRALACSVALLVLHPSVYAALPAGAQRGPGVGRLDVGMDAGLDLKGQSRRSGCGVAGLGAAQTRARTSLKRAVARPMTVSAAP